MWFHNQFFATNKLFSFEDAHFEKNKFVINNHCTKNEVFH